MAVKAGVVAPSAWLKLTGMKRRETFPRTTVIQKIIARVAIL